jgi:hypothetical protein
MIRGQVALLPLGFDSIPIYNLEAACASSSHAFNLAVNQLRAGAADVVLAVGAEKMYTKDKAKMFSCFESAWDLETLEDNVGYLEGHGQGDRATSGLAVRQTVQPVHGRLRGAGAWIHVALRRDATPDRGGGVEEPRSLGAQRALAVPRAR